MIKKINSLNNLAVFFILSLFFPSKTFAACNFYSSMTTSTKDVSGWTSTCTIATNTVEGIDKASSEGDTTNTARLTIGQGGSITINAGAKLVVGALTNSGGSISILNTGSLKIGSPLYIADTDADGWPDNFNTFYDATASGRRRLSLMKSYSTLDCGSNTFEDANLCVPPGSGIIATGGTISTASGYTIHTFTTSGTFNVQTGSGNVDYLIVGGGGGGAPTEANTYGNGGGGAGGLLTGTTDITPGNYPIVVGTGGSGVTPANGVASSALGLSATGGGKGGIARSNGTSGGSGGGAGSGLTKIGGTGVAGQGYDGGGGSAGSAGAGGGCGGVGTTASGPGCSSAISGVDVTYASGGARGTALATDNCTAGVNGTANRGNGGGGGKSGQLIGCNGGSGGKGIVIIRYTN